MLTNLDLNALADRIADSVRHEVQTLRNETIRIERGIYHRIDELKEKQTEQNGRVNKHEATSSTQSLQLTSIGREVTQVGAAVIAQGKDIIRLFERTKHVQPALGIALTAKQKSAVIVAGVPVVVALIDGARHVIVHFIQYLQSGPVK
jgi:hypothetical protein